MKKLLEVWKRLVYPEKHDEFVEFLGRAISEEIEYIYIRTFCSSADSEDGESPFSLLMFRRQELEALLFCAGCLSGKECEIVSTGLATCCGPVTNEEERRTQENLDRFPERNSVKKANWTPFYS